MPAESEDFCMIDDYLIDVLVSEDHAFASEVTDHPVESGSVISDNIRSLPVKTTMEGIVSKTPFSSIDVARSDQAEDEDPVMDAYFRLFAIRERREPVTIRTSLGTYFDMAMESFNVPRDANTGEAFRFKAVFKQIKTVTNRRSVKRVAVRNGTGKTNRGTLVSRAMRYAGIPVVSFPTTMRGNKEIAFLGKPILSTVEGGRKVDGYTINSSAPQPKSTNGIRYKDGQGPLDHYKLTERQLDSYALDGYVNRGIYYRLSNIFQNDLGSFAQRVGMEPGVDRPAVIRDAWAGKKTGPVTKMPPDADTFDRINSFVEGDDGAFE